MLTLVGLAAYFLVTGGSLWLVMGQIYRRALANRKSPLGALLLAFVGYMVGTVGTNAAAFSLWEVVYPGGSVPGPLIFLTLLLASCIGAVVGSGGGYVFLWARTTHDPDYEPLDRHEDGGRRGANR